VEDFNPTNNSLIRVDLSIKSLTLNTSGLRAPTYIVLNQLFKRFTNQRLRRSLESALLTYNALAINRLFLLSHNTVS